MWQTREREERERERERALHEKVQQKSILERDAGVDVSCGSPQTELERRLGVVRADPPEGEPG